jgi:hypothetical protein
MSGIYLIIGINNPNNLSPHIGNTITLSDVIISIAKILTHSLPVSAFVSKGRFQI